MFSILKLRAEQKSHATNTKDNNVINESGKEKYQNLDKSTVVNGKDINDSKKLIKDFVTIEDYSVSVKDDSVRTDKIINDFDIIKVVKENKDTYQPILNVASQNGLGAESKQDNEIVIEEEPVNQMTIEQKHLALAELSVKRKELVRQREKLQEYQQNVEEKASGVITTGVETKTPLQNQLVAMKLNKANDLSSARAYLEIAKNGFSENEALLVMWLNTYQTEISPETVDSKSRELVGAFKEIKTMIDKSTSKGDDLKEKFIEASKKCIKELKEMESEIIKKTKRKNSDESQKINMNIIMIIMELERLNSDIEHF